MADCIINPTVVSNPRSPYLSLTRPALVAMLLSSAMVQWSLAQQPAATADSSPSIQTNGSNMGCCSGKSKRSIYRMGRTAKYYGVQPVWPLPPPLAIFSLSGWSTPLPPRKMSGMPAVDSLQPTLCWNSVDPSNATKYDLTVWTGVKSPVREVPFSSGRAPVVFVKGIEVYQREGIEGCSHRVDEALLPDTVYVWAVRTRSGTGVGPWSTYAYKEDFSLARGSGLWWSFRTPYIKNQ